MQKFFSVAGATLFLALSNAATAGTEGMASMPTIQPKRVYTVTGKDDLRAGQGFGDQEPMVKMMNLMMVEGSGMEGMDMEMPSKLAANDKATVTDSSMGDMNIAGTDAAKGIGLVYEVKLESPATAKVGVNVVQFKVTDIKTKKPARGLKLKSQVAMTNMDMGTESPQVSEKTPGVYEVRAGFSMKGPWAVKIQFPDQSEKVLNFEAASMK